MKFITNLKNNLARTALTLLLAVLTTMAWAQTTIDLSTLTADYTAQDGDILTGTTNYGIIIPDGATITLYNAKILRSGQFENPVKCNGSATIIIADDSNNEIKNTHDSYQSVPGIAIGPSGSTFTLNGNTGELTVQGGKYAAGIGTKDANAGNIVINGGHLVVKSGTDGTGIGPDCSSISYSAGMGNITINGGTMTITGGSAGIGATDDYTSCGTITINDGYVNVVATYTGIGGKCTAIEIKDGTVYATGRNLCPGIGGHQCGPITISGGTVSAITNTNYAAGIGSGYGQTCGDIIITGGTVTATGGNTNAPGIGKGDNGGCGKIIIGKDITSVTAITQSSNPPINPEPNLFVASNITDVTDGNTRIFTPDPTAPEPEELEKDADGYYLIGTVQDWKEFRMQCAFEPIANARMTADIDLGNDQTVIGSFDTPYQGTFDGQGHALTMAYVVTDASSQYIAPFSRLDNATVQNLHVKGTITTAGMRPAGITSYVSGTSYVKNCWSEVDITSSRSGDIDAAGLVARINSGKTLRISDCVFTGSINYTHDNSYVTGGLVAWMQAGANVYMDNCLFAPSCIRLGTDDRNYMLVGAANGTATITNSYYNSIGQDSYFNSNPQGTYATDAQLTDGTIAYKLQNNRVNLVWGQRIGIDAEPVLTSDENYRVYRCINGGYTNDSDLAYTGLVQDAEGYYLLGSLLDWQEFAALVQTTPTANAKMTADIDLGNDQTVIGSTTVSTTANSLGDGAHYKGIFDGQGHTLTVAYNATGSNSASPFSSIEGAIIKNLHIDGTMVSSYYCGAGVASATGGNGNVIQNVWVSTTISATNGYSAGFVGCAKNGSISIVDCLFTGSVTSSQSHNGCFVGYIDSGSVTVTNCLSTGSFTYYGCAWQGSHTNCYVKQFPASIPAAMQVTDGQLADGTIAFKLQKRRENLVWGQRIGIDDEPVLTSDESYRVYKTLNDGYTNDPALAYTGLEQDADGYYLLGIDLAWIDFAALVNGGTANANARMTADIDLGDDQTILGATENLAYKGTFDGQGHTLTVNLNSTANYWGPFRFVGNGATIQNLRVDGTVNGAHRWIGGFVGQGNGTYYINNCISSVTLNTTYSGDGVQGGFVAAQRGTLQISDCIFDGVFYGPNAYTWGGIVGWKYSTTSISNCLVLCDSYNLSMAYVATFIPNDSNITNCYYKTAIGTAQGTQATAVELADGTTVTALQNGREEVVWVQDPVLNQPMLKIFANSLNINVTGYQNENNRWMFIASPIAGNIAPSDVDGLLGMQIQDNPVLYNYDLYRFNQSGTNGEWENYHQHNETGEPFMLVNGKGYLYAKQNDATLKFYGTLYNDDSKNVALDYDDEATFAGFNLVGNPFAEEATINMDYYKMNAAGDDIEPETSSVAIPALTGVIVEATGTGQHVTFTKSGGSKSGAESEKTGSLQLTLSKDGTVHDKAIVSFNEGAQLGKYIFNENHAKLYIPQGSEDYAIAFSNGQNEMPLNFKASKSGEYCINVTPEGVEMAYLHLIDNMTGADVDLLQTLEYTFTAKTTDYESRFRLVFSVSGDANDDNADAPFAFINNGNIIVNGEGTVQVIDVMGRIIVSGDAKHCVSTTGMVPGVYVLRLIDGNTVKTQKMVID